MPVVGERLTQAEITTHPVTLPNGQDINDFFLLTANPKEAFNALLGQANPAAKKENDQKITKTDFGFTMAVADRRYEVRGISKKGGKLKATVKGIDPKKRMHVDTVDFYSARSRTFLLKGLTDLFGADEATVTQDHGQTDGTGRTKPGSGSGQQGCHSHDVPGQGRSVAVPGEPGHVRRDPHRF